MPNEFQGVASRSVADARILEIFRRLKAPPTLVFKVLTDPVHLARWFGPEGFTVCACRVDVKVGGEFDVQMAVAYHLVPVAPGATDGVARHPFGRIPFMRWGILFWRNRLRSSVSSNGPSMDRNYGLLYFSNIQAWQGRTDSRASVQHKMPPSFAILRETF